MRRELQNELILAGARARLVDLEKERLEILQMFPQLTPAQVETKLRKTRKTFTEAQRKRILSYAEQHGVSAAAEKFECSDSAIHRWKP